jgi:hypothetical protein
LIYKTLPKRHQKFIIEQILSHDEIEDFQWAVKFYGKERIKKCPDPHSQIGRQVLELLAPLFHH